jgi:hypothetical protein
MSPVATSDAAFRGGACPTPEYTVTYTGNYTTSADASMLEDCDSPLGIERQSRLQQGNAHFKGNTDGF